MPRRILLTGFKPFLKEPLNPSELLVQNISALFPDVSTLVLPVSYDNSYQVLQNHWQTQGPFDAVIMLGQAGGRSAISLERVAINWSENSLADEDGVHLNPGPLVQNAPESYISHFFPADWKVELSKIAETAVSFTAGTYVCNSLYFKVLHGLTKNQIPALFVHVPYIPEQTADKPNTPSMALDLQLQIIKRLVEMVRDFKK